MTEIRVGALANYTAQELAERAVDHLLGFATPHAVCIDPRGRVSIELYEDAVFEDVVGVYGREPGLIALYRQVRDDLVGEIEERGIVADTSHRRVRAGNRKAA